MKKTLPILCIAFLAASCINDKELKLFQVEPFAKILYTDSTFVDAPDTLCVARGENAVFQFVLLSDSQVTGLGATVDANGLQEAYTGWVHDVHCTKPPFEADDVITTPNDDYPDPVIDDWEEAIDSGAHRTLRVDIAVPRDAEPGVYKCSLKVTGNQGAARVRKQFFVKVYPVTLPENQSLTVVNWFNGHNMKYMNSGKEPVYGTDEYFELLRTLATTAAANGQNCWMMPFSPEAVLNGNKDGFVLDFTNYNKTLEILREYGNMKYFCNPHFGRRREGSKWNDAFVFNCCTVKDGELVWTQKDCNDPELEQFIKSYYSQFREYMRERGLLGCCYQHIADEPAYKGTPSQISYSKVAAMMKEAAPGLRIADACFELVENQDVSVVQLSDNIATMPQVPQGSERWMYTCCGPQGNFANRFVQLPLIKTRILHWLNYKYNECGYLHWGFNFWDCVNSDPLVDITPKENWPGGDCYIVYPGNHKVYPSMRLGAMRDGIRDYDLLKMVEAKDPAKAREFCDSVVQGPDRYNTDPEHFRRIHTQMLEFLSE